jgi:hypothetical protein
LLNIAKAWAEVTQSCLNAVYKTLWPHFVHSFKGFEKEELYQQITDTILEVAEKLKLEADITDV